MTATNGRDQATDILSGTDALAAAAEAAHRANLCMRESSRVDAKPERLMEQAARYAQVAQGLSVYAATVGKWAAR
jgi:hypothetical protein